MPLKAWNNHQRLAGLMRVYIRVMILTTPQANPILICLN